MSWFWCCHCHQDLKQLHKWKHVTFLWPTFSAFSLLVWRFYVKLMYFLCLKCFGSFFDSLFLSASEWQELSIFGSRKTALYCRDCHVLMLWSWEIFFKFWISQYTRALCYITFLNLDNTGNLSFLQAWYKLAENVCNCYSLKNLDTRYVIMLFLITVQLMMPSWSGMLQSRS